MKSSSALSLGQILGGIGMLFQKLGGIHGSPHEAGFWEL